MFIPTLLLLSNIGRILGSRFTPAWRRCLGKLLLGEDGMDRRVGILLLGEDGMDRRVSICTSACEKMGQIKGLVYCCIKTSLDFYFMN